MRLCPALVLAAMAGSPAPAQTDLAEPPPRELSTDRPDKTESPYTVEPGRIQVEMDFVTYTLNRFGENDRFRLKAIAVAPINVKFGLTRNSDIQIVFDSYIRQEIRDRATGAEQDIDGFGDVTIRLKHNLWGNDGGDTALAVMPFVKLPTNSDGLGNDAVEGGVIIPLALSVSERVGIGLMTELDWLREGDGEGYSPSFINSATVAVDLTERFGMYTELFTEKSTETGADWVVTWDTGLTYAISGDIQLDGGVNLGVTEAADDLSLFIGLSRRF